jgi:hypothetical protein
MYPLPPREIPHMLNCNGLSVTAIKQNTKNRFRLAAMSCCFYVLQKYLYSVNLHTITQHFRTLYEVTLLSFSVKNLHGPHIFIIKRDSMTARRVVSIGIIPTPSLIKTFIGSEFKGAQTRHDDVRSQYRVLV